MSIETKTIPALEARVQLGQIMREVHGGGLEALYTAGDPEAAAAQFRTVLAQNPAHCGATLQLATALDRGGTRDEARPVWQRVLTMAEGYSDTDTTTAARAHLAEPR